MAYALTWLADVLRAANLKVAETPGWTDVGRADMGVVRGIVCHHTATAGGGNMPSLTTLIKGRSNPALIGPLAQLGLARDGTYYVIAAGVANHAGKGAWQGVTGNSHLIGIEAENSGLPTDPWPDVQMDAYKRGAAALLDHLTLPTLMCCGHKEFAPKRKVDPSFDMVAFRTDVQAIRDGQGPVRPPIAAQDAAGHPTLRRGSTGDPVKTIQAKVGVAADGTFGAQTEAAVRVFQRQHNLVPDGIVGPATWTAIGA
jgi:N-acetyl-anhydromuramyl-L-alanine amidase AmpD